MYSRHAGKRLAEAIGVERSVTTPDDDELDEEPSDSALDPAEPARTGIDSVLQALAAAPRPALHDFAGVRLPDSLAAELDQGPSSAAFAVPAVGAVIDGRYRIDGQLGAGGMGVVFAAVHLATGRRVALKWLQPGSRHRTEGEREAALSRFVREAQAVGRIRHPNVVDVHDAGTAREAPFLVMELLEGETLRARIDRAVLGWDEALALLLPVLDGVEEAHLRGVVHRDLKPDNVFLARRTDGSLCPKVLDFGISRLHGSEAGELPGATLTRTGAVIGTPAYMPLEQLRATGEVDARTDVYALGVVLYEMLSQKRPYVARNAADFAALMSSELPTPLSKHRPDLRGSRERSVMKALSCEPSQRYPSVRAFALALGACEQRAWPPHLTRAALAVAGLGLVAAIALLFSDTSAKPSPTTSQPEARVTARASTPQPPITPVQPPPAVAPPAPEPSVRSAPTSPAASPAPRAPRVARPASGSVVAREPAPARTGRNLTVLNATDFEGAGTPPPSVSPAAAAPKAPSTQLAREQF